MVCTIRGEPNPLSTQSMARIRIRSMSGFCMKVSGSTSGRSGLMNPMVSAPLRCDGLCFSTCFDEAFAQRRFVDLADRVLREVVHYRDLHRQLVFRQRLAEVLADRVGIERPFGMQRHEQHRLLAVDWMCASDDRGLCDLGEPVNHGLDLTGIDVL